MYLLLIPLLLCSAVFLTTLTMVLSIAWVWVVGYVVFEFVVSVIRLTHYVKEKLRRWLRLLKRVMHKCVIASYRMIRNVVEWMTYDMPHFLWYIVAPLLLVLYLLCMWVHYVKK